MNYSTVFALASFASVAFAGETPRPFSSSPIELPPLGILDAAKAAIPPVLPDPNVNPLPFPAPAPSRYVSRMPVVAPGKIPVTRMPIVRPDETIDYKLTVKTPDMGSDE